MEEEEEEGKIPRFIRHCTPLRCENGRFSSTDLPETELALEDDESGNAGSIRGCDMVLRQAF
jgi:hypothetical protein